MAAERDGKALRDVEDAVAAVCRGEASPKLRKQEGASFEDRWQVIGRNRRRDVPKRVLERLQVRLPLASDVREVHLLDRSAGVQPEHHADLCERRDHEPCDAREHRVVVALLESLQGVVQQPQPTLGGGNRPRPIGVSRQAIGQS